MASGNALTAVKIPPPAAGPQFDADMTVLPLELVDSLNHAYFLHLLATNPGQVLPPGKSLLSVLSRSSVDTNGPKNVESIQSKVEQMMRKAFWNEAIESLANPTPSVQLARLGHLYKDLYEALKPILPANHPLLFTLSGPLSPTSAPLGSAVTHLREALCALRERCAPARDPQVDALVAQLDANTGQGKEGRKEAEAVVSVVRGTLELAEVIRDDLTNFVVGALPEKQLVPLIRQQARMQERAVVLGLWDLEAIRKLWDTWLSEAPPDGSGKAQLMKRVVKALSEPDAVACNLPKKDATGVPVEETTLNTLPPPFLLSLPALFYVQNFLQAIVIAAALCIIAQPPPPSTSDKDKGTNTPDFMQRIWSLLLALIPERRTSGDGEEDSPTKLINLEDEVLRARRMASSSSAPCPNSGTSQITAEDEKALRAAVQRTLQTTDPVFKLLQTRLITALSARLSEPRETVIERVVPPVMHTGKDAKDANGRPSKRPRLSLGLDSDVDEESRALENERGRERPLVVKGFEDPVLVGALAEAMHSIRKYVGWVEETWEGILKT